MTRLVASCSQRWDSSTTHGQEEAVNALFRLCSSDTLEHGTLLSPHGARGSVEDHSDWEKIKESDLVFVCDLSDSRTDFLAL